MISTIARIRLNPLVMEIAGAARLLLTIFVMLGSASSATTITGAVINLSRSKPSSGDDVILYRVDKSMHEVMRAQTDVRGTFRFEGSAGSRYLIAAIHEKVSYHTPMLRAFDPATVFVYDAEPRLAAVHESSTTLFPALEGPWLKITQFFVVSNPSAPPRTLVTPFHFQLPKGAVLDSAAVQPPGTLPSLVMASACGARDQYCVASPIRPGETKIRVIYHFDFHGGVSVALPLPPSVNQTLVKIPESLHLQKNVRAMLRNEGQQNGLSIYSVDGRHPGHTISFSLFPATPKVTGANAETTATSHFEPRDADYEMRSLSRKTAMPTPVPWQGGRSPLDLIILLGVLVTALFGATVKVARLARAAAHPEIPELSSPRKAQ